MDTIKLKLNENEAKMIALKEKLKEVKLRRDWAEVKFNRLAIVALCLLTVKWFFCIQAS